MAIRMHMQFAILLFFMIDYSWTAVHNMMDQALHQLIEYGWYHFCNASHSSLYWIYSLMWTQLTIIEQCYWHVDNMMEEHFQLHDGYTAMPLWLRTINQAVRITWKVHMRIIAFIHVCYINTGDSGEYLNFEDYQILACIGSDGPTYDLNLN